jgi:outer membrane lipoprotein-sorting protein
MMRTLSYIALALLAGLSQTLQAQNARTVLDKAAATFSASGEVLNFTLKQEMSHERKTYSQDGTAWLKANKFKIDLPESTTWFNGQNMWALLKGSDEVNLSAPAGDELQAISPNILLSSYKSGFNLAYKGAFTEFSKQVYRVEMTPQKSGGDITRFVVNAEKNSYRISSVVVYYKDGNNSWLIVRKQQSQKLDDSVFSFNKKNFPGVEVIDLR